MTKESNHFKDTLFFESIKEFWNERGRGAKYRLNRVGVSFFKDQIKLGNSRVENVEKFKKYLIDNHYCTSVESSEEEFSFSVNIHDCCLKTIRQKYEDDGMEILCCPIANMFMYIFELETQMSPELLPIQVEHDTCKLAMAKIGTDEVTEEE